MCSIYFFAYLLYKRVFIKWKDWRLIIPLAQQVVIKKGIALLFIWNLVNNISPTYLKMLTHDERKKRFSLYWNFFLYFSGNKASSIFLPIPYAPHCLILDLEAGGRADCTYFIPRSIWDHLINQLAFPFFSRGLSSLNSCVQNAMNLDDWTCKQAYLSLCSSELRYSACAHTGRSVCISCGWCCCYRGIRTWVCAHQHHGAGGGFNI